MWGCGEVGGSEEEWVGRWEWGGGECGGERIEEARGEMV